MILLSFFIFPSEWVSKNIYNGYLGGRVVSFVLPKGVS